MATIVSLARPGKRSNQTEDRGMPAEAPAWVCACYGAMLDLLKSLVSED